MTYPKIFETISIMFFADLMDEPTALPTTDFGSALLRMVIALAILLFLLGATYWLLRRIIRHRLTKGVGVEAIQLVEKRMISPKTTLYLVSVDNKRILFAESQLEVTQLSHTLSQESQNSEH
ncbi:MAG: flagellar biosynthetic protein FliO [Verrucomicrobiota bacterium]|nr:flagellar biosynthetic protein FliO [Verrucomicrobiota bacterium]